MRLPLLITAFAAGLALAACSKTASNEAAAAGDNANAAADHAAAATNAAANDTGRAAQNAAANVRITRASTQFTPVRPDHARWRQSATAGPRRSSR